MIKQTLDCDVASFTSPAKALDALPLLNPAVVATDFNMPEMNGLEFIRSAGKSLPRTSFLLITGHDLSAREAELAELPRLRACLGKPCSWRTLADEIVRIWPDHLPKPAYRVAVR